MTGLETFRVLGRGKHKDGNGQHHYRVKQTRLVRSPAEALGVLFLTHL